MPLEKDDAWFMLPNIAKKGWKNNETRTFVFQDDGRDMQTETGIIRNLSLVAGVSEYRGLTHRIPLMPAGIWSFRGLHGNTGQRPQTVQAMGTRNRSDSSRFSP